MGTSASLDFDRMSPRRLFTKMFFPTLLGMFSGSVMNITDGIFVGQRVGSDALAAINIAAPIFYAGYGHSPDVWYRSFCACLGIIGTG